MQNNKVFITGGTGFAGSHILKQLISDGFECSSLFRATSAAIEGTKWVKGDLLDPVSYENDLLNVDTIVHAAGFISYQRKDKNKLILSNYIATRDLVNSALHSGIKNFIYVSSASTLIRSGAPGHIALKSTGNPVFNSFYARTKFLAELEIWRAAAEGLNVCIVYPSLMIGDWSWEKSSMQVFGRVKSGLSYYPPGNLGVVGVEDVARIISLICKNEIRATQILINAEVISYKEFLNEIAAQLHLTSISRQANYWQARAISFQDSIRALHQRNPLMITPETIRNSFAKFTYEPSAILESIHFEFQNIQDLIQKTIQQHIAKL